MAEKLGYKNLKAWEKCDELAKEIYRVSASFPRDEIYALTSQLRRAGLSAPTNIVEGYARRSKSKKEFYQFLTITLGSLAEAGYLLDFAKSLGYVSDPEFDKLSSLRDECSRLVWGLIRSQTVL